MIANIDFIQDRFNKFNNVIFNNSLPLPKIRIGKATRSLGTMGCDGKRNFFGKTQRYNFRLTISSQFDLPENELEDVIIHEMIHYYIMLKHISDTGPHGETFKRMMNDINAKFNRNIYISRKSTETTSTLRSKPHYVCVSKLADGRTGITIATKTRIFELWKKLPKLFCTKQSKWYWTCNPYFNKFPKCIKPKIYIIDEAELVPNLKDAIELQNDGTTIKRKSDNIIRCSHKKTAPTNTFLPFSSKKNPDLFGS